jgi:rhamnosyl/mannosyltransferase
MRVLHCYKSFFPETFGGVPQVVAALARGGGATSSVLVARRRGFARTYRFADIPVEAVGALGEVLSMPIAPSFPFRLAARARDCDVLALHQPFPLNDLGVMLGIPREVAVVVHWHSEIVGQRRLVPLIEPFIRHTLGRAERIVVSDPSMIDNSRLLRPHVTKCAVIPFGVDIDYWRTLNPSEAAKVADIRAKAPRLIVANGRLVAYKGFATLIEAAARIDAELVIIGDGPLRKSLAAAALRCGLGKRLSLPGNLSRDELKIYLHAARVLAFPSVSAAETFGISQVEAMAVGLPVVNTNLPTGVPRVARHDIEALTVPVGDAAALAGSLARVLDDPALAARFGAAGRARADQDYGETRFINRIERLYEDAAAARGKNQDAP